MLSLRRDHGECRRLPAYRNPLEHHLENGRREVAWWQPYEGDRALPSRKLKRLRERLGEGAVTRTPCAPPPVAFRTSSIVCGELASTAIATPTSLAGASFSGATSMAATCRPISFAAAQVHGTRTSAPSVCRRFPKAGHTCPSVSARPISVSARCRPASRQGSRCNRCGFCIRAAAGADPRIGTSP